MNDLPTCGECKYWDQRYPENIDLGVCPKMGIILFSAGSGEDEKACVSVRYDDGDPVTDVPVVRTRRFFGCRGHSSNLSARYTGS